MRLYSRTKSIAAGVTAGINNKAVMLVNPSNSFVAVARLNVKNMDGSIAVLDFTIPVGNAPVAPNHCIIPLEILNWEDTSIPPSTVAPNVYLLY